MFRENRRIMVETQAVVELIRKLRHDYGNVLQIIGAYLEMDMSDKAQNYIKEQIEELKGERVIFNSLANEDALYLYMQRLQAKELGFNLFFEDLEASSWGILKLKNEPLASLERISLLYPPDGEEPIVYLSIYETEQGLELFFTCAGWERPNWKVSLSRE